MRAYIVVAEHRDWPTGFVYPAAEAMYQLLALRYTTKFLDTTDQVGLARVLRQDHAEPWKIACFLCHGSKERPALRDINGNDLLNPDIGCRFRGSILVLTACLYSSSRLPEELVQPRVGVRAVIGYRDVARIGEEKSVKADCGAALGDYQKALCGAFQEPLRWLLAGAIVKDAAKRAECMFHAKSLDRSFHRRIRLIFGANAGSLAQPGVMCWGDLGATLE